MAKIKKKNKTIDKLENKKKLSRKALVKFAKSELANAKSSPKKTKQKISTSKPSHTLKGQDYAFVSAKTDAVSLRNAMDEISSEKTDTLPYIKTNPEIDTSNSKDILHVESAISKINSNNEMLKIASMLLSISTGIAILFGLIMAFLPGGNDAVPAMGGVLQATAPLQTAQIVFALDILFPITFGAGFALLACAFQRRGNRPVVRMILTALLFVVLADFSENALVYKALIGGETYAAQWPLTVVKYAMLGLSAVLLSSIIIVKGVLGMLAMLFLRIVFPISVALLVAGIGGRMGGDIVGATFPVGLLLLAVYANTLCSDDASIAR